VNIPQGDGKPNVAFSPDGTLKSVELKIMNLRPDHRSNLNLIWEEVIFLNKQIHDQNYNPTNILQPQRS
jgi:hypothetical protein